MQAFCGDVETWRRFSPLHPVPSFHTKPPPYPTTMAKLFGWPWPLNISILADILRMCYETRRKVLRAARSPPARSSTSSAGAGKLDEAKIRWLRRLKSDIDDFTRTTSSLISSPGTCRQRQSSALDPRGGCALVVLTTAESVNPAALEVLRTYRKSDNGRSPALARSPLRTSQRPLPAKSVKRARPDAQTPSHLRHPRRRSASRRLCTQATRAASND